MPDIGVDPDEIGNEATRWFGLADRMTEIRQEASDLTLGVMAFFPGGMTEAAHHSKYRELQGAVERRLRGAAVEFELIGVTLRNIAASYDAGERVTSDSFRVSEEELDQATEAHTPPAPPEQPPYSRYE